MYHSSSAPGLLIWAWWWRGGWVLICSRSWHELLPMVDWNKVYELLQSSIKQLWNWVWVVSDVLLLHELKLWVLNQLSERNHQAPWVRATSLKPLQEDLRNLLENYFFASLGVNRQYSAWKVESVLWRVSQFVHYSVQEAHSCLIVQPLDNLLKGVSWRPLSLIRVGVLLVS